MQYRNMNVQANNHRILIVDDEEIIRLALKTILEKSGIATDEAGSALEGLSQMEQHQYSLVISDHKMPGMSGLDFLGQVKKLYPQTIRILTTVAFNIGSHINEINRAEVFQFIIKPWDSKTLLETVERGLKKFESDNRSESLHESSLSTNQALASAALNLEDKCQSLEQQTEAIKANWVQTIQISLGTCHTYSPWMATQAQKVRRLCSEMANELRLSDQETEILDIASQLYDIGMVSVPLEITKKWRTSPTSLTPAEWEIIHEHPLVGANLARFKAPYDGVSEIIKCHHECLDGSGFPLGLKGHEIPRLARLLGAAVHIHESSLPAHQAIEKLPRCPESTDTEALQAIRQVVDKRTLEWA
jgi:response regulator RpfG family c-di-GMP phosphodiesterase